MIVASEKKQVFHELLVALVGLVLLCLLFLILVPRIQMVLFPQVRHAQYEDLLNKIQGTKGVDLQKFLSFRDMYGSGILTFNYHPLLPNEYGRLEQQNLVPMVATTAAEFSRYTSSQINSIDYTVDPFAFNSIFEVYPVPEDKIIHDGPNFVLYNDKPGYLKLVFIVPFSSYTDIVGDDFFINNTDLNPKLVQNSYWMDISTIRVN